MSPAELARCGRRLFGPRWQTPLARAVGIDDQLMRRWLAGERSIPEARAAEIRAMAADSDEWLIGSNSEGTREYLVHLVPPRPDSAAGAWPRSGAVRSARTLRNRKEGIAMFKLSIRTTNAAFHDGAFGRNEIARILRDAADAIESGQSTGTLRDTNGNRVGGFECTDGD